MADKVVVIEGFLLSIHSPTVERLMVNVDCTSLLDSVYIDLIINLEDLMTDIDKAFVTRKVSKSGETIFQENRGRTLHGRYRKVMSARSKRLKFTPYPSSLPNRLGSIRRNLYERVNKDCVVLQEENLGAYKRCIYLLPFNKASAFLSYISGLNLRIEQVNQGLREFQGTEDYHRVQQIIELRGLSLSDFSNVVVPNVKVDLTPLSLNTKIVMDMIEQRYKNIESQGMELLRRELESKRSDFVSKAIDSLQREIMPVIQEIAANRHVESMKKRLQELSAKCDAIGLQRITETAITPVLDIIDHPEHAMDLLGVEQSQMSEVVSGRLQSLIQSLM